MTFAIRIEDSALHSGKSGRIVSASRRVTVGRSLANDVVLDDKSLTISKQHCVIEKLAGRFQITDCSRNGTFLNASPDALPPGVPVPLQPNDRVQIGGFTLVLLCQDEAAPVPSESTDPAYAFPDDRPESSLLPSWTAPGEANPSSRAATPDHAEAAAMVFVAPAIHAEAIPHDWDPVAELGLGKGAASTPGALPPTQHTPDEAAIPEASGAAAPAAAGHTSAGVAERAIDEFFAACGLAHADVAEADLVMILTQAGEALRLSVEALHEILSARALAKQEFGIEATMLGKFDNNPLKYVNGSREAMRSLLLTSMPGFLTGPAMVAQGFADIKRHQLAMLDAMSAALASVCEQLAPKTIASTCGKPRGLAALLPAARRSRYWIAYAAAFDRVTAGLDNDASRVFGRAFASGYRGNARPDGPEVCSVEVARDVD